jgi:hypothetical protein
LSSSLCVQTGSGAHLAFCTMGTGGSFPGAKARPERDADRLPPPVPSSRMSRSYTSSPPKSFSFYLYFLQCSASFSMCTVRIHYVKRAIRFCLENENCQTSNIYMAYLAIVLHIRVVPVWISTQKDRLSRGSLVISLVTSERCWDSIV